MGSNYTSNYNVDIVMCIDATGSMRSLIEMVKRNAMQFGRDLRTMMERGDSESDPKYIDQLRVRVIAFRDYLADGDKAMLMTDFFTLPEQSEDFSELMEEIHADGGGDDPEDGLEALGYAIRETDWVRSGERRRHIIVVWSDEGTHEIGFGKEAPNYPKNMAKSFAELSSWWEMMEGNAKRLILFTPDKSGWTEIDRNWENTLFYKSEAGKGLEEYSYQAILSAIKYSV